MAGAPLQTSQAIASALFDELETKGFSLSIPTEEGEKTPTKDFSNALVDALLKGLKDNAVVEVDGMVTIPQPGVPTPVKLVGKITII